MILELWSTYNKGVAYIFIFIAEEKFNLTANYCSHIEEHTDDAIYGDIEKEVFFIQILGF